MPPAGHFQEVYSLDFATQNRSLAARERPTLGPPLGGRIKGVAALRLTLPRRPARAYGAPRRGACRPPTPWAAPPGRPSAAGHRLLAVRWVSEIGFSASEARQAEGTAPVGKGGGSWVHVGSLLSTCAQ